MARYRPPVTVTVEWADPPVDVTAAVTDLRVSHGTSEGNPDRPQVATARGSLTLVGDRYQPGRSDIADDVLHQRVRCVMTVDSTVLWRGWIADPRVVESGVVPITRYTLSGTLTRPLTKTVAYVNSSGWPSDDDWTDLVGQVPRLVGDSDLDTAWAPYSYDGPAGTYLGQIGVITGRLPGEDRLGRPALATFRRLPDTVPAVTASRYQIRNVQSEQTSRQIRNIIDFPFDPVAGNTMMAGAEGRVTVTSGTLTNSRQVTIAIPQPVDPNTAYSGFSVSLLGAQAVTALIQWAEIRGTPDLGNFRGWYRGVTATQLVDISDHVAVSYTVQGGQYMVTFTISDFSATYTTNVQVYRGTRENFTRRILSERVTQDATIGDQYTVGEYVWPSLPNDGIARIAADVAARSLINIQLIARLSYTVTSTGLSKVALQNADSRDVWDDRRLEVPLWLSHAGLQAGQPTRVRMQADLDHLAEPRTYHDVVLPLWQENAARTAEVAAIDFGSYVDLGLRDTFTGLAIADKCVVTERNLVAGAGIVPAVRLRCLATGEAGTPVATALPLGLGGIPLRLDGTPLRLEIT